MRTFERRRQFGEGSPLGRDISTQTWQKNTVLTFWARCDFFFDFQVLKRLTSDETVSEIFSDVLEDPRGCRSAKLF